jgi:small redox-active disulfide protein 2
MTTLDIKILGPGCRNCRDLEQATREALETLGLDATVEKVTDIAAIAGYGVMATPGLVVDGRVVSAGRVPDPARIAELLAPAPQG